jgi:transcription antitermination factor NusG
VHSIALTDRNDPRAGGSWYALYTKHQHERAIARNLMGKGFETFLPLYAAARRWKDRVKILDVPLFPCYVFLRAGAERRLDVIITPGVYDFVSSAGHPATIPAAEIEAIRQAVGSGARIEPHPFLRCGDRVRVKCGPLVGIEGVLVRKRNVYRLVLSVEMLGKAAAVEIDAALVERLDEKRVSYSAPNGERVGLSDKVAAGLVRECSPADSLRKMGDAIRQF